MPSIFKKLSSKRKSTGISKKKSSDQSSIFRLKKSSNEQKPTIDPPTTSSDGGQFEQPCLTWTSSFESAAESQVIVPSFSNSSDESSSQSEIESLKQSHSEELERMSAQISKLEKANESLKMEKETSEQAMLEQESEIIQKNSEIISLSDSLAKTTAKVEEEESSSTTNNTRARTLSEEIFGNEYQRKYETVQTIVYHQELDIVTKAEEISYLQSALRAQELQHGAQLRMLQAKLLEREDEIKSLKDELTVTSQLVSQTASMLLKHQKKDAGYLEYWTSGRSCNHTKTS
ncbi:unnamed protein product [Cylindrotheca closterium]|uniref:Uncharacterized protein n=1 Tax=Cylindrotheca closterium TaxID=2856 RepID=A0AAD2G4N8_9STRA|nr:unnamed protein product [Cylindrotheca closterium]